MTEVPERKKEERKWREENNQRKNSRKFPGIE